MGANEWVGFEQPATRPKRYAIYCRTATISPHVGESLETQAETLRRFVDDKGGVVAGVYSDGGHSGSHLGRPAWQRLLKDAQGNPFASVVCTDLTRLGRGIAGMEAERLLAQYGVTVESLGNQPRHERPPSLVVIEDMVETVYHARIRFLTLRKMEAMIAEGYFCGGSVPFGYQAVASEVAAHGRKPHKRLVPVEAQASAVQAAFAMASEGFGTRAIRSRLSPATGRSWTHTAVRRMLTNEVYLGVLRFGIWRNDEARAALIDREVWDSVQTQINRRRAGARQTKGNS